MPSDVSFIPDAYNVLGAKRIYRWAANHAVNVEEQNKYIRDLWHESTERSEAIDLEIDPSRCETPVKLSSMVNEHTHESLPYSADM